MRYLKSSFAFALMALCTPRLGADTSSQQAPASFSFVPNQLGANAWYRPGNPPSLINDHLDSTFGNKENWPVLLRNLKASHGSFSVFAAEIGWLSSKVGLLPLLKSQGVPISVETPGFTQCISGDLLAQAEINGKPVNGANIFSTIFGIASPVTRTDPAGKGWFVTEDGKAFIPNEILFDERIPNLLPMFEPGILARPDGTWERRKAAARIANGCPSASLPYPQQLSTLMQDYVTYLRVARTTWGSNMPAVSLHWNVNPGWEWRDERGLDAIHANSSAYFDDPKNFWAIVQKAPQYNSVTYLNDLIETLTSAGFKPRTVYMDVDWTYDIPYITETLKRHKAALHARGVQMGINVVEASIGDHDELVCEGGSLKRRTVTNAGPNGPNVLYENTLLAIMEYLKSSGIYEKGMQIRVGSWSHRPYEKGGEVDENRPGSLAHTANQIIRMLN